MKTQQNILGPCTAGIPSMLDPYPKLLIFNPKHRDLFLTSRSLCYEPKPWQKRHTAYTEEPDKPEAIAQRTGARFINETALKGQRCQQQVDTLPGKNTSVKDFLRPDAKITTTLQTIYIQSPTETGFTHIAGQ